ETLTETMCGERVARPSVGILRRARSEQIARGYLFAELLGVSAKGAGFLRANRIVTKARTITADLTRILFAPEGSYYCERLRRVHCQASTLLSCFSLMPRSLQKSFLLPLLLS